MRKGWHFASRRTKEGAERAIECFQQAATQCPGDFRAFEGLSTCYLMQATFGICAPIEVYPRFLEAHTRAVEQGTLNRSCVVTARMASTCSSIARTMLKASSCARSRTSRHCNGARPHGADVRDARSTRSRARTGYAGVQADPLLPTLPPVEGNVRVWRRSTARLWIFRAQSGRTASVPADQPGQLRAGIGIFRVFEGGARAIPAGSIMSGDLPWMRALEGTCLAKLGRTAEAHAILDELQHRRDADYADALYVAVLQRCAR